MQKVANLMIDGPNKSWMEIQVRFISDSTGIRMMWQQYGPILKWSRKNNESLSGTYSTANYPSFVSFADDVLGGVFQLGDLPIVAEPRFPFTKDSSGGGFCIMSGLQIQQGDLRWKVISLVEG